MRLRRKAASLPSLSRRGTLSHGSAVAAGLINRCTECVYMTYDRLYEKYMEDLAEYQLMYSSESEEGGDANEEETEK